jgi:hypothetical protein
MDWTVDPEYRDWKWERKSSNAPNTHQRMAGLLDFFVNVKLYLMSCSPLFSILLTLLDQAVTIDKGLLTLLYQTPHMHMQSAFFAVFCHLKESKHTVIDIVAFSVGESNVKSVCNSIAGSVREHPTARGVLVTQSCVGPQSVCSFSRSEKIVVIQELNGLIKDTRWHVKADEVAALMGAHTILMTHGCTTTGTQPANGTAMPDMGDRTCGGRGGRQRMFTWDNSFFKVRLKQQASRTVCCSAMLTCSSTVMCRKRRSRFSPQLPLRSCSYVMWSSLHA